MKTLRKAFPIVLLLLSVACGQSRYILEEQRGVKAVWVPESSGDYFVALAYSSDRQFRFVKRSIPDGKLIWESELIQGRPLDGSLFNSPSDPNGFWFAGSDFIGFFKAENNVKKIEYRPRASAPIGISYPLVAYQICELEPNKAVISVDGGFLSRMVFRETGNHWELFDARLALQGPLCVAENRFIVQDGISNVIFLGEFHDGLPVFKKLIESSDDLPIYTLRYSQRHKMLALHLSKGHVQMLSFDAAANASPAELFSVIRTGDETIGGAVFHPEYRVVFTLHRRDDKIKAWNFAGRLIGEYDFAGEMPRAIEDLVITSDGKYMILVSDHGYIIESMDSAFPNLVQQGK